MKKIAIFVPVVVALLLGFVIGGLTITSTVASTTETTDATEDNEKIYVYNHDTGFILNDFEARSLVRQSTLCGYQDTPFMELMNSGVEIADPESGLTFVINEGFKLDLSTEFKVYKVGNMTFMELINNNFADSDFKITEKIKSTYGDIVIYSFS